MQLNHTFKNFCLDWDELLSKPSLYNFMKKLDEQCRDPEAQKAVHTSYKDYSTENTYSPRYFGMGVEVLAEAFLNHYSHIYKLHNVVMTEAEGSTEEDLGVDGEAKSNQTIQYMNTGITAQPNSSIFLQVKGTMNSGKVFLANDGTRLPNFMSYAQVLANQRHESYQARYILFTTGDSIHYTLDKMTGGRMEVINYKKINKLTKNDIVFWNAFRAAVGLVGLPYDPPTPDAEGAWNMEQNAA